MIMGYKKNETSQNLAMCPFCQALQKDSDDFEEDEGEKKCDACGEMFEYQKDTVDIFYTFAEPLETEV